MIDNGIRHLREFGVLATLIAAVIYVKNQVERQYYFQKVQTTAESIGTNLSVNGPTRVTEHTILGDNVNFNGLRIRGGEKSLLGTISILVLSVLF